MKRPGFERIKRRTHIRLSLEHLEHRRLMAGLNVLVFTDQDGSRSLSPSVDVPAPNRLVFVDMNRNLRFEDGEPLAVAGDDGIARFPGLAAGDYFIGLAANNSAQLLTTSVAPDARARTLATAPGAPLTSLVASPDLKHAWSVTGNGVLTPVGTDDGGRAVLNLNGSVLGVTAGSDDGAWALVDHGQAQPTLYRLDFQSGSARMTNVVGVPFNQKITGIVRSDSSVYFKLNSGDDSYVAELRSNQSGVSIGQPMAIPSGTVIGSPVANQLAVIGNRSELNGEDKQAGAKVSIVQLRGNLASIQSIDLEDTVSNVSFSPDGQTLFASRRTGGVEVYSINNGIRSAAELAEAVGPVSASGDGRFVTGNANTPEELIVWDSRTWTPTGRVQLPSGQGPLVSLAVDKFGDRVLAATSAAALTARLSNPVPQAVQVATVGTTQASLGVRLIDRPVPLPTRIQVSQATDEDVPLSFDLSSEGSLSELGSGLFFAPGSGTAMGTLLVTPSGRVTYRSQANANGSDSATLRVFDGVSTTTLVISLDVRPVNDAPTAFVVDPMAIDESASTGDLAGFATVFDVDSDARYEITTSDPRFVVVNGQVMLGQSESLDYETESSIELEITATDMDNPAFVITRKISIPVRDTNDAPTAVALSASTVTENETDVAIGNAVVTDPDGHGNYTYSVSDDRFEFSDGLLRLRSGAMLNYESEPLIALTITVLDETVVGSNKSVSSDVTVFVLDGNDAPTSLSVEANELPSGKPGAVVGRVQVADEDAGDSFTFNVSDSRFVVDGNVLKLRDGESISSSEESVVTMLVTVTDKGGAVLAESVTLNVSNDAPFQNPRNPFDVDNDGVVIPRDAIILVNQLNQKGSHILTPITASGEAGSPNYFLDINGDGVLSPLDALILINHLNQRSTPSINTGNGNSTGGGSSKPPVHDTAAEGEGPVDEPSSLPSGACQPWLASSEAAERARRDAIDAELELLVEELSQARVRGI